MGKYFDKLKERLTFKYRLVILDEETYEEQFSFKLSQMNVYVFGGIAIILLILLTSLVIAYTPLREYVPGYASTEVKEKAEVLIDSLEQLQMRNLQNEVKMQAVMDVLSGKVKTKEYLANLDSLLKANKDSISKHSIYASKDDSLYRQSIENQDRYNVSAKSNSKQSFVLFAPVTGTVTNKYKGKDQHYGIDIAVKSGTPIKSVEDGTVIFAEWSVDTGYVIIIDHGNNLISVYKHNSSLLKNEGDLVKSGEVVATAGSEGKLSTAPHLHFELWYNGYPMDPTQFIAFE
jgi:murein DD-endopeptidase MepM/ murein hydrolase activator NlpD